MLGFLELPEDDVPPELIWHNDAAMEDWWERVKERRKHPNDPPMEEVPMTKNELAEQYR